MKKIFFISFCFFHITRSNAQRIAAYFDSNSDFTVFDDGITRILQHDTVLNYGIGSDFVAYVNSQNQFAYYYKGDSATLEYEEPESFTASQNYLVYKMGSRLKLVEKGEMKILCSKSEKFAAGDSIIAWNDKSDSTLKVYYSGVTTIAEKGSKKIAVSHYSVSQNLAAFISLNDDLNVWWHGKTYFLSKEGQNSGFQVGTDLVAFASQPTNEFRIFYKGEILAFPKLFPRTLKVNNNAVAYVDQNGHFDIFYNGETVVASQQVPFDFAALWDQVSFIVDNEYRVFFKGKIYVLDDTPSGTYVLNQNPDLHSKIPVGNAALFYPQNSFIFYDKTGIQNIFYKGEIRKNTSWQTDEKLKGIDDLIVFTDAFGKTSVYYKGRKY